MCVCVWGGGGVAWSDTSAWVWGGCPAPAKTLLLAAEGGREGSRRRWGGVGVAGFSGDGGVGGRRGGVVP